MSTLGTPPPAPNRADVLLVTVTEVETRAVLAEFQKELKHSFSPHIVGVKTYLYLGNLRGAHIFLVQSEMGSGGTSGAMLTIADSIQALQPAAIVMVGIAFGVDPQKQRIGDILVARQLLAYDLQRVGSGPDDAPRILPRGDRPSAAPRLLDRFRTGELDWKSPRVRFGLVLSGDKLVDHQDYRDALRRLEPEAIGGEMEGAGLYAAAQRHKVDWILVKAICDYADGNKNQDKDKRQQTAARNAARFVVHVLRHGGFAATELALSQAAPQPTPQPASHPPMNPPTSQPAPSAPQLDPDERAHLENLRKIHRRRLQVLQGQSAQFGAHAPAQIITEMEDIRKQIAQIDQQLGEVTLPPAPIPEPTSRRPTGGVAQLQRQRLERQLDGLKEEYEAVSRQLDSTLAASDRLRLERQLQNLAQEMQHIEDQLA